MLLAAELEPGDRVTIGIKGGELGFEVSKGAAKPDDDGEGPAEGAEPKESREEAAVSQR
jgi:hypothetical protein